MRAIRKLRSEPGLDWCEGVAVPTPGPRDVIVSVTHAGICGTDRHIYEWDPWSASRVKPDVTVGHEFVGKVVALGEAVQRVSLGDRVSAEGHIGCGTCEPCRTGNGHICEHVDILGIDCDGSFAEYVRVPEDNVWQVHPKISDKIAAVLDPIGNAMHTVMAAGVSGRSVLITGVGIIGLMAVTIARAAGAGHIIVSDVDDRRLKIAGDLGAHDLLRADDPQWVATARKLTHGQGPQVLLEMSGHPQAVQQGLNALRNGGTAAMLGLPAEPVTIDLPNHVIFKGAKILGINGRRMFETWFQMESFLLSERLTLEPIITHQLDMADYKRGFEMMQSGEAIKVVLKMPANS